MTTLSLVVSGVCAWALQASCILWCSGICHWCIMNAPVLEAWHQCEECAQVVLLWQFLLQMES